ncbi:Helix-turn-helix domain protein [Roseovarius tolerans]|uniref:Helix-turn-helix domain protein n=1 Tax=Roseovarius tolerans TaxID=74031 RepID=A0A0L6CQQ4_9RHOB|nr:winged helix-turn-helix domain-containing protein [Roseovarius tolerans]KNX40082.1 Helix-turn-helix domain protein [Roseovarius tolerans]
MITPRLDITGHALANASRARMLCAMMDGRAWTNKELAADAGVTPQTASAHLHHLEEAGLITQRRSGRCLYHRIAGPDVAAMLEHVARLTPLDHLIRAQRARAAGLAPLRRCYNHLAGAIAVALCDALIMKGALQRVDEGLIAQRSPLWARLGVVVPEGASPRPSLARPCLDWSERRDHIGGALGQAILEHALAEDWIQPAGSRRGLRLTAHGRNTLTTVIGCDPDGLSHA